MRIRKHAKISPLLYAASSLKPGTVLQTHLCQLNQSPWDVMSFSPPSTPPPPPPPSQVNGSDVSAKNGSSGNCVSVVERELNTWRRSEYPNTMHKLEEVEPPPPPPPPPAVKNEQIVLCCKTDGKSWQCRREAAKGNSLCEHHLSLVKSYSNNSAHHPTKKSVKPAGEAPPPPPPRRPRPKKAPSSSSSTNPYEFYYYSGFGPRWGKKRGETGKDNGCNMPKNLGDEHENEIEAKAVSQIGEVGFDYVEYEDDDEEEEEKRDNVKKRVRKPIKARSLKSLM